MNRHNGERRGRKPLPSKKGRDYYMGEMERLAQQLQEEREMKEAVQDELRVTRKQREKLIESHARNLAIMRESKKRVAVRCLVVGYTVGALTVWIIASLLRS